MAKEDFVAVACDDWYQRRKQDAEGEFFMKVAEQGRKGPPGQTKQGIYVFSADGKLLGFRNHQDASVMRDVLKKALGEWKKLPAEARKPGAIKVADLTKVDPTYDRKPPKNLLIVNVFTRILDKDAKGEYCHGACNFKGGDQSAHDHLWITEAEWKALVPPEAKVGTKVPLPPSVLFRIVRFHLVDNTR